MKDGYRGYSAHSSARQREHCGGVLTLKMAAGDVRDAMARPEGSIPNAIQATETLRDTLETPNLESAVVAEPIN